MIKRHYNKSLVWLEKNRFLVLLLSTILTLVLPAFFGSGMLSEVIFVTTLSFLFIQSTVVAEVRKSQKLLIRIVVISMMVLIWLKPVGYDSIYIDLVKLSFIVIFFIFVVTFLIRFISRSKKVDINVLITSINIYLLAGIIGASLCLAFYQVYPDAYNFPAYIEYPVFAHFLYYSFITMSTVGYGDITPRIPETQTLAYLLSISGQLYVAIIIAFLIGKMLMQGDQKKTDQGKGTKE
jgi:voltage-gated potassium channel